MTQIHGHHLTESAGSIPLIYTPMGLRDQKLSNMAAPTFSELTTDNLRLINGDALRNYAKTGMKTEINMVRKSIADAKGLAGVHPTEDIMWAIDQIAQNLGLNEADLIKALADASIHAKIVTTNEIQTRTHLSNSETCVALDKLSPLANQLLRYALSGVSEDGTPFFQGEARLSEDGLIQSFDYDHQREIRLQLLRIRVIEAMAFEDRSYSTLDDRFITMVCRSIETKSNS